MNKKCIEVIDTHTGGEPTRVVFGEPLALGEGPLAKQRDRFQSEFDSFRQAIVCEPRGGNAWVGALLTAPVTPGAAAGVIFFNNVGFLGMCGHGTIGVAVALAHLGQLQPGTHRLDTPVGLVEIRLLDKNRVELANVPSYRFQKQVSVQTPDGKLIHGDIAWGGNWFFICSDHGLDLRCENLADLQSFSIGVRKALEQQNVTAANGELIDHIELIGPPTDPETADSKNFVLCPGGAYDRSPCGTGTSAKLACLAIDGQWPPNTVFRQESIVGSIFEASYVFQSENKIVPTIVGRAFVNSEARLIFDPHDPFCMGMPG